MKRKSNCQQLGGKNANTKIYTFNIDNHDFGRQDRLCSHDLKIACL